MEGLKMQCPKCQFENQEEMNFCGKCGFDLKIDRKIPPKSDFHPQSYTPKFLADKILTTRSSIEGERKLVTVLFADVANYTSMSERLNPEEIHQIMDGCFKILMDQIHDHLGTINQFTGDGVMALFGAPLALENHAKRACEASLAIQNAIENYSKEIETKFRVSFKMRIGLNTGQVVVGSIGDDLRMDYTAIGDTTNLAARMESSAEPGTILISPNTYKQIRQYFIFEPMGKTKVKGKEEALDVYKLVRKTDKDELGLERQIFFKMVGRDKDLNKLELQVMKAIDGQGSIVNIIGEAGIGKSRLIAELKKKDVMKNVVILEGKAISIGRNLSFHPIINLLKHWSRIKDDDSDVIALGKLEGALRNVCADDTGEILPFVATTMGMKLLGKYAQRLKGIEGEALEKLILKNMKDFLTKAADLSPLVIVMEDLHWADTSSIDLMESFFRLAETQRILFINVFRPGHKETGDRIVKTIKEMAQVYYVEIVLEPLNQKVSEALITNMLTASEVQQAFILEIIQRAGGNPFFVTEKVGTITIPHKISDVLMARIDRLEDNTRNLLKVASVIGRNFFYRILTEVARTIEDIDQRLYHLKEVQLIRERRRMEEIEYLFKHALAQEATYESILPQKRKELHLKVASSIENVFSEKLHEFYGMLAYHYSKAENLDRAEEALIKAGEEALNSSASSEALHYYQEALSLYLEKHGDTADPEKVAMLEKNIALALYNRGKYEEAVEYFDKSLNHYWGELQKGPILGAFKFMSGFLNLLISLYLPSLKFKKIPTQQDEKVIGLFFKKLKALGIIDAKKFFIESIHFYNRFINFDLTKFESAIGIFAGASSLFSFTGISFGLSRRILNLVRERVDSGDIKSFIIYDFSETLHHYLEGNWKNIADYNDELVNNNLNMGEIYWASQHIHWHCLPRIYQGNFNISNLLVLRLNDIYEVYENDFTLLLKQLLNTGFLLESRNFHDALIEIEQGIEFSKKTNQVLALIHMFSCRARVQIFMGNIEEAGLSIEHANTIRHEAISAPWQLSNFRISKLEYDLYLMEKAKKSDSKTKFFEHRKKALKSCKKLLNLTRKVAQHRTEAYKLVGVYYWLDNKQKKALEWWNKSIKVGERLYARPALSRTYFEVGKRMIATQSKYKTLNRIKTEEYIEKAKNMFKEMDLQWDLDELAKWN
jgi:class 3 adenylate cyclase/tetratricopeptide (TPR) repeat protein